MSSQPSPVDRGPFNRAADRAIAEAAQRVSVLSPSCGALVDGAPCGLAAGHMERSGTDHQSFLTPAPTYQDRLRSLADFLDATPGDLLDSDAINVMSTGPSIHLERNKDWRALAELLVESLGPASHDQTHETCLVLRIRGTQLGTVTLYVPRWAGRPIVDHGPEVDLTGIVSADR